MTSTDALAAYARATMRRLMKERRTTQMDLVPVLGIAQVSISDRVRGRTPLTLADIERLARYWGVAPVEFFPSNEEYVSACTRLGQVSTDETACPACGEWLFGEPSFGSFHRRCVDRLLTKSDDLINNRRVPERSLPIAA